MIMKNGDPYQMLTRITEKRAQKGSLNQGMLIPTVARRSQLIAL